MATQSSGKRAVNLVEARAYLGGVSHQTIYRLMSEGMVKTFKIGKRRLILVSELDRYIDEQIHNEQDTPTLGLSFHDTETESESSNGNTTIRAN